MGGTEGEQAEEGNKKSIYQLVKLGAALIEPTQSFLAQVLSLIQLFVCQ